MKLFAGKTPTERNKIIAAIVLGVMCLFVLFMTFGRGFFSSKPTVTVKSSPTPKPSGSPSGNKDNSTMPTLNQMDEVYSTIPVVYNQSDFYAPDAGRNIFAFYEPPPPTPYSPTPTPEVIIKTPTPIVTPTPPYLLGFVMPQSVYAGSKGFRIEVNGDKFTPEARIIFNGVEIPTTFISPQKLVGDISAQLIAGEGQRQILVQSPDGKLYSLPLMINVQAPPRPAFQYIGMIARKRYNNDTAYFQEQGKNTPTGARLNDIVGGRFKIVSISAAETIVEDTNLGFRHKIPLMRPIPGQTAGAGTNPQRANPNGFPGDGSFTPYNPGIPNNNPNIPGINQPIPGIPSNIPRYVPPQPQKQDVDDEDVDGDN